MTFDHPDSPAPAPETPSAAPLAPPLDFAPPAPPPPNPFLRIFIGTEGVRAGWSALIFVCIAVIAIVVAFGLVTRGIHINAQTMTHPGIMILVETLEVLGVFVATFVMAMIESRNIFSYGFLGARKPFRFLAGAFWGFASLSALVATLWRCGYLAFDGRQLSGIAILHMGLVWALGFLLVGFFEESFMRGYLQYTLTRGFGFRGLPAGAGFWIAAVLLSAAFGASHTGNSGESPIGLFSAGAVGLVFCLSLWYTKSLWWAVGFHASWDWAQSFFFGTADSGTHIQGYFLATHPVGPTLWSGGATGPEGSLFVLPLLVIISLGMWIAWGRRPSPTA